MEERLLIKGNKKDTQLKINITKDDKELIKRLAKQMGFTVTDLIKYSINKVIEEFNM